MSKSVLLVDGPRTFIQVTSNEGAKILVGHAQSLEQAQHLARLIAAAPELLHHLKELTVWWASWMPDNASASGGLDALKDAQAAIAKAEGK